jgi:hypothetical protein
MPRKTSNTICCISDIRLPQYMPKKWLPTRRSFSAEPGRLLLIGAHYGPSGYDALSGSALSLAPLRIDFWLLFKKR